MAGTLDADYEALKRLLLTPVVRTLRIMNMRRQGRSAKEIATIMRMSETAVRGVIKRAKQKLGAQTPRF
jgi:DNA-directed RNA polymerase specialized sigma24 family protein